MRKLLITFCTVLFCLQFSLFTFVSHAADNSNHLVNRIKRQIPIDQYVITQHKTTILDKKIAYSATTGTQPIWDELGNPTATLFYTYYQRTDIKDNSNRPLVISFNGGPGSASVWMHVAYTGPKVLRIDTEGYPIQPYGVMDNPHSILDVADIAANKTNILLGRRAICNACV